MVPRKVYRLSKKIAALRITGGSQETALFTELPQGARVEVELETPGVNSRMITVRYDDQLYSVFIHDIDTDG